MSSRICPYLEDNLHVFCPFVKDKYTKKSRRNEPQSAGTAKNEKDAMAFGKFLLSAEGQNISKETGQPPVVPAIRKGNVPAEIK